MTLSFLLYLAFGLAGLGAVSLLWPLRSLGIRNRWVALAAAIVGLSGAETVLSWPARSMVVSVRASVLDDFAPTYQFSERHEIPVRASAHQIYSALLTVSADEIPFYRQFVWVRRGGQAGAESILNPPDGVPLLRVATRTSFITLADVPGVEYVVGTVVIAPPGVRLALGTSPDTFRSLTQPGFAKATIGFRIEPRADGWCLLRTETRVDATDYVSRATFARYWRVISPASSFVRLMWLRAVKVRSESFASVPAVSRKP